MEAGYSPL
jgi:hypothetical protein